MSLHGQCLCGAAAYDVAQLDGPIVHCHCQTCRKAHASAFATTARVERAHFRWLHGAAALRSFESSPGKLRWFCGTCGTHLVAERRDQPHVILRVATLDDDPGTAPAMHIWIAHDVAWLQAPAGAPRHPEQALPGATPPPVAGETALPALLAGMQPDLVDGAFVFLSLPGAAMAEAMRFDPTGVFVEPEGISVICRRETAERHGLQDAAAFAQITLGVQSSLHAVGLTAAVAARLAAHGISANVVAGYHHDHLFVPLSDAARARTVLLALQAEARLAAGG